jgi:peptidoglycan/xylan/chitin deacetylase (PgdA/CDA1 family)
LRKSFRLRSFAGGLALAALSAGCARDPVAGDPTVSPDPEPPPAPNFNPPAGRIETTPTACEAPADAAGFTFEQLAGWRDDADAAYAMVHDDLCGPELRGIDRVAMPALEMRNLTATFGPFVRVCQDYVLWDMVKGAEMRGHEIANHSLTHVNVRTSNAAAEVMMSKRIFDAQLMRPVSFFIFPFDDFSDSTIDLVKAAGHIGARAGTRDDNDGFDAPPINGRAPDNDLTLEFDAWPRAYSKYASFAEGDILNLHVWRAIERKGFAMREFHSVTSREVAPLSGEGFGPVPLRLYEQHLDFLINAWKANKVWTSTASTIIRYRQARTACSATVSGELIRWDTTAPACAQYATPLSVIVKTGADVPGLKAMQGDRPVFVRKLGPARFSVTADPTAGDVSLAGCATPVPAVDPSITLPPKPEPAQSVCDLESVKGSGGPGRMDDFERAPAALQVLPNPGQADGRTGSWSWHPANTQATIVTDGSNRVLRYQGARPGKWSGVTLAFLGGNGAGSCYDARTYHGLRFKVKGSVDTPDNPGLASKIIVSLITADTQSQKFGGDLKGEGGHFNVPVMVTPEWTMVSLTWADFGKPTWGDSMTIADLALNKLQAIDWGTTEKTAVLELYLDDIELF